MEEILSKYAFLPWLRRGLSSKIDEKDNFNNFNTVPTDGWNKGRPEMDIRVNIDAKKGDTEFQDHVAQKIKVVGPGDIVSIDKRIVVKTEPKNWITNFEPNYFPYIEFYEEDFPWRYSPAAPKNNKLRPWLSLIVLKESEFTRDKTLFASLPSILVTGGETDPPDTSGAASNVFPNPGQTWAWSHVHMNGDVDTSNTLDPANESDLNIAMSRFRSLLKANPDQAVSRMMCPRKLEANTTYYCFLIPAFETGRLAGLGAKGDLIDLHEAQKASFGADHSSDGDHQKYVDHFPYYYDWQFMTGDVGDFESLVRKLVPREVDRRVGKRPMDVQQPGYGVVHGPGAIHNEGVLMLEGAMLPPRVTPEPDREPYPWSIASSESTYRKRLAQLINLSEDLRKATFPPDQFYGTNPFGYAGTPENIEDDPIITPDLYGRWHALKDTLNTSLGAINFNNTWLYEVNLDPRSRSVAGLGVKHVKNNQEKLMDKAWSQLGEVIEANRKLKWGQLSKRISYAAYKKHLASQKPEQVNAISSKLFKRIKVGDTTAYKQIKDSALPNATQSYAFRKIERPQSPLMKRLNPGNTIFKLNTMRVSLANGTLKSVDEKTVSADQATIPLNNINEDVNTIANHNVSTPIFATMQPNVSIFEPNIESEVRFHSTVATYQNYFDDANWQGVAAKPTINLADLTQTVITKIDPRFVIPRRVYDRIRIPGYTIPPADKIVPVMAYPKFNDLMYEAARDLGTDYLIPNLELIPNNSITLLESNQKFIEAFMLGVNHEMGRELLWREFPTDQRGSYFQQFWDSVDAVNLDGDSDVDLAKKNLDIDEIHNWASNTELGTHSTRPGAESGLLILVIRGDLLKKYPDTVIYAQKAAFKTDSDHANDPRELVEVKPDGSNLKDVKRYPVFSAKIEPDIHFFGFDLDAEEARGDRDTSDPGWFFVIQERPGEIRFGVDVADSSSQPPATWNDLSQSNAAYNGAYLNASNNAVVPSGVNGNKINNKPVAWGFNATNMAQILYQNPMLLAVHGDEMIP